jgi:hypothetical protein
MEEGNLNNNSLSSSTNTDITSSSGSGPNNNDVHSNLHEFQAAYVKAELASDTYQYRLQLLSHIENMHSQDGLKNVERQNIVRYHGYLINKYDVLCNKYETLIRSGYHRIAQPSHFYD